MTRWARTKSAHRHERLPSEATSWSDLKPNPVFSSGYVPNNVADDSNNGLKKFNGTKVYTLKEDQDESVPEQKSPKRKRKNSDQSSLPVMVQERLNFYAKKDASEVIEQRQSKKRRMKKGKDLKSQSFTAQEEEKRFTMLDEDKQSASFSNVEHLLKPKNHREKRQVSMQNTSTSDGVNKQTNKKRKNNKSKWNVVPLLPHKQENQPPKMCTSPFTITMQGISTRDKMVVSHKTKVAQFGSSDASENETNSKVDITDKNVLRRKKMKNKSNVNLVALQDKSNVDGHSEHLDSAGNNINSTLEPATDPAKTKVDKDRKKKKWRLKWAEKRKQKGMILLPEKVERKLISLRKALTKSGKSGEEIKDILRKERRKHELLHRKKQEKTCFRCQTPGHTVSDCRAVVRDNQQSMGICFRCGSTEHILRKCPQPDTSGKLPYAKCFVCHEQGHLSGQCPKNSRGVYPKGGACSLCGSINHLKKDCPTMVKEKDKPKVVAHKLDSTHSVDANVEESTKMSHQSKMKVVKF